MKTWLTAASHQKYLKCFSSFLTCKDEKISTITAIVICSYFNKLRYMYDPNY